MPGRHYYMTIEEQCLSEYTEIIFFTNDLDDKITGNRYRI